jgi:hypothetical protein
MKKIEQLTKDLSAVLHRNSYKVEIDTEDIALGFRKTNKLHTRSLAKALSLRTKTLKAVGRYISPSVRIVAVRWYKNGALLKSMELPKV